MFFDELLTFVIRWFQTRQWKSILKSALALVVVPCVSLSLIAYGYLIPLPQLAQKYLQLAGIADSEELVPESDDGVSKTIQVPLRRILQLGAYNNRAVYAVAVTLVRQGRIQMAAKLMRDIAPENEAGFAEAHSWLAQYALTAGQVKPAAFRNDLQIAANNASNATAWHIRTYAQLLASKDETEAAAELLKSRKQEFPELALDYAEFTQKLGDRREFQDALQDSRKMIDQKFEEGKADVVDVYRLVRIALLEKDLDRAVATARAAFKAKTESPQIRRLYAEVLCEKYRSLKENEDAELGDRMEFLEAAFNVDPTCPLVMEEFAKAIESGLSLKPGMRKALNKAIADGKAPTVVHVIIANNKLASDEPETAIPHLELALKKSPNSGMIKNNLAFALLKGRPDELGRAAELVASAMQAPEASDAMMLGSMLDTQGQIRKAQSDLLGAIESFEKAINIDGNKMKTRARLAYLYRQIGMDDLAAVQESRIKELEAQQAN